VGYFQVWEGEVAQNEQQFNRKLKQLEEVTMAYALAMACE